jgi:hypothetical protein
MLAATRVSSSSFTVVGNHTVLFEQYVAIKCVQGVDGTLATYVGSSSYSGGSGLTTVVVEDAALTNNLTNVLTAYVAPSSLPSSVVQKVGGLIPISEIASGTPDGTKFVRDDGTLAAAGGSGGGVGSFPNFYVSGSNAVLPKGIYPQAGYRHKGVFPEPGMESWTLTENTPLPLHPGSISGPNPRYCSVFMMGDDSIMILPILSVKGNSTFDDPDTSFVPGQSDGDGGQQDVGIAGNWQTDMGIDLTDYRLVKHSYNSDDGSVFTIVSVTASSPDVIVVEGDKSDLLTDGTWLRMIPPVGIPCLYLGLIVFNGQQVADYLLQVGWKYYWKSGPAGKQGVLNATPGFSDLLADPYGVPATAIRCGGDVYCSSGSNNAESVQVGLYLDLNGNPMRTLQFGTPGTNTHKYANFSFDYFFTDPGKIGNAMTYYDGDNTAAADSGYINISDFEE